MTEQALATRERAPQFEVTAPIQAPWPVTQEAAMLQMIERVIRDPSIDIERVKAVLDMKKEIDQEAAKKIWASAMSDAQAEMRAIVVDRKNSQTKSVYASYDAIDRAIRPIYTKHGFSLVFDEDDSPLVDHIRVVCDVSHRTGYTRQFHKDMPADGKGAKGGDVMTKTHATGSASTYGQRYLVKGIFNLAISLTPGRDDDDDGNAAGNTEDFLSEAQIEKIRARVMEVGGDKPDFLARFLRMIQVERLEDVYANKFADVMRLLDQKATGK